MKLSTADPDAEKTVHMLKSSNLPFYKAIWEAAKSAEALVTFHKRFYWDEKPTRQTKRTSQKRAALVDIVAENGEEWIKVSTTTQERLLRELAKARWEVADSSEDEEEIENASSQGPGEPFSYRKHLSDDEYERVELVRMVADLTRASRVNRIHYKYPQVRIIFSKLSEPVSADLEPLFERIRAKGAIIDFHSAADSMRSLSLESDVFPKLLPSPFPTLTRTVNIDCTILLALVSDLSYSANHPIHPTFNAAIRHQIELETQDRLLPLSLWPALANKQLVCTAEAASRMRGIVETIGTPSERARTELIMEDGDGCQVSEIRSNTRDPDQRREQLQKYSDYPVPASFTIPIEIRKAPSAYDISVMIQQGKLPAVAEQVAADLTDINQSIFMFGWMHRFSTVSSNRTVVKAIERLVDKEAPGEMGPEVWVREPARSLVGKEKERRK